MLGTEGARLGAIGVAAGIALGTAATLVVYHLMSFLARVRGTVGSDPLAPDTTRLPSPLG